MTPDMVVPMGLVSAASVIGTVVIYTLKGKRAADSEYVPREVCDGKHKLQESTCARHVLEQNEYARHAARDAVTPLSNALAAVQLELRDIKGTLHGIAVAQSESQKMVAHLTRLIEKGAAQEGQPLLVADDESS